MCKECVKKEHKKTKEFLDKILEGRHFFMLSNVESGETHIGIHHMSKANAISAISAVALSVSEIEKDKLTGEILIRALIATLEDKIK